MDKKQILYDIGTVTLLCGLIGERMKLEGDDLKRVVTDEEMKVLNEYANLADAIYRLSVAVAALPEVEES